MFVKSFTYDGISLSTLGYTLCNFNSGSDDTRTGSTISFSTTPIHNGGKFLLSNARYEECLTTTLQICKNPCNVGSQNNLKLSPSDISSLMRWLNKKSFKQLTFDSDEYSGIIFEASFNVSTVSIGGEIYGLELEVITNRPFAIKSDVTISHYFNAAGSYDFTDTSDEIGFLFPSTMVIVCEQSGDLTIANSVENRITRINNCTANEVITINYPAITSSVSSHKIQDDFNYVFFRIANTATTTTNTITVNKPCTILFTYNPIIKITL